MQNYNLDMKFLLLFHHINSTRGKLSKHLISKIYYDFKSYEKLFENNISSKAKIIYITIFIELISDIIEIIAIYYMIIIGIKYIINDWLY